MKSTCRFCLKHVLLCASACLLGSVSVNAQLPAIKITTIQAQTLFGGDSAKLIMCYPTGSSDKPADDQGLATGLSATTYLLDFSAATYSWKLLTTKSKLWVGDPSISWDGTRFAYNNNGAIIVQDLSDSSVHVQVATGSYDQRWWVSPAGDEYIIYVTSNWANGDTLGFDDGRTYLQKLVKGTCQLVGTATKLLDIAMRNGRSANGKYMFTCQPGRAQAELVPTASTNAFVKFILEDNTQSCNGSYNTDINRPNGYSYLAGAHNQILQGDANPIQLPAGYTENTYCEWSTHPDYLVTNAHNQGGEYQPANRDICIYQASKNQWTKVSTKAGTSHLWVKRSASTGAIESKRLQPLQDRLLVRAIPGISKMRQFEVSLPGLIRATLIDVNGRRIAESTGTNSAHIRCPANISAGAYIVKVKGNNRISTQSVMIE